MTTLERERERERDRERERERQRERDRERDRETERRQRGVSVGYHKIKDNNISGYTQPHITQRYLTHTQIHCSTHTQKPHTHTHINSTVYSTVQYS